MTTPQFKVYQSKRLAASKLIDDRQAAAEGFSKSVDRDLIRRKFCKYLIAAPIKVLEFSVKANDIYLTVAEQCVGKTVDLVIYKP